MLIKTCNIPADDIITKGPEKYAGTGNIFLDNTVQHTKCYGNDNT